MLIPIIGRLFGSRKGSAASDAKVPKITITGVNLKFMGHTHGLAGMTTDDSTFSLDIPFQNKMGSDLLPDNLKGPPIRIGRISVAAPFKLLDVSPALPAEIAFMSKVTFRLKVNGPDVRYEGPLAVDFGNEASDTVNIMIKRVMLHRGDRTEELENSDITANMQKSQVFKQSVQMYKILSLGDTVSRVEVNMPFEVVSTEPKLPVRADRKDSYIISIYMKCPEFSYAGDLDIKFS